MSLSPHMQALYKRPVILWVEDGITSDYLLGCWQNDPDISLFIAGGSGNIRSVVNASRLDGHTHVFGFTDRDMGNANVAGWFNAGGNPVFVPTVHEVENYLLQAVSLAGCASNTTGRTEAEIETRLQTRAGNLVWYMACRKVLAELRLEVLDNFPSPAFVATQHDAEQHILNSLWYANLAARAAAVTAPGAVTTRLTTAHAGMAAALASGDWRRDYPGKDLLHDLRDWLYVPPVATVLSGQQKDRDLAKAVAAYQVANGLVPQEVRDLRAALRHRVGLPP